MQQVNSFTIPYEIVDPLSPTERFVYYELCRLAVRQNTLNEEFRIRIPKGSLITSTLRLSKILDMAYSKTGVTLDVLADRSLIEMIPLETGSQVPTFFLIQVKKELPPSPKKRKSLLDF
ncbi:hypothetical protein [Hazenella coriacea]|uniref:Uncharacterized protein n=1 Tax=Hazenella coriacea TaxID=1179467 RepID=A0A4R3L6M9_9BACL|nr:hypothetical protein [Hazenella coriacea]TCS95541.1 hypothetical protein EDD58_102114 [Hazenella coriacea]